MTTYIAARHALTSNGWRSNIIIEVDEAGRISALRDADKTCSDTFGVVLPALSNLHSHSFQRAMSGLTEVRGPQGRDDFWSWRRMMYRFLQLLEPDDFEKIAALVQMEMLESGYAAYAEFHYVHHDPEGNAYDQADEISHRIMQAAMRTGIGLTHLPVLYMRGGLDNRPLEGGQLRFGNSVDQFARLYEILSQRMKTMPEDFVLGVAPHSLRAVDREGLKTAAHLAPSGPIHIHIAEQLAEVEEVTAHLAARPVEWLLGHADVNSQWCLVHATHMVPDEISQLARTGAVVGLCPITEANLGDGIFPAPDYLEAGGRFGVGSDSNVRIALSEELRLLEMGQRLRDKRRVVVTGNTEPSNGAHLYTSAAHGGAQALSRRSGCIEVGALADLVALDDRHYALSGLERHQVIDAWVFGCGDDIVTNVWSAGRHVVADGMHIRRDDIIADFKRTITRLRQAI